MKKFLMLVTSMLLLVSALSGCIMVPGGWDDGYEGGHHHHGHHGYHRGYLQ